MPRRLPDEASLLAVAAAAELLDVERETVMRWIRDERVPYIRAPSGEEYVLPMHALLITVQERPDLWREVQRVHEARRSAHDVGPGREVRRCLARRSTHPRPKEASVSA